MALKAVQALVTKYRQLRREIYRLREGSMERIALEKEVSAIRNELTQIFKQCDEVLEITKNYKREKCLSHMFEGASDPDICCLD